MQIFCVKTRPHRIKFIYSKSVSEPPTSSFFPPHVNSHACRLTISFLLDAPVCSNQQQGMYGSGRKEIINITCSVESYPLPTSFTWALNTSATDLLDVPRSHTSNKEYSSVLTYTPHTPLDYGSLLCWAENDVGRQKEPCVFQVSSKLKILPLEIYWAKRVFWGIQSASLSYKRNKTTQRILIRTGSVYR